MNAFTINDKKQLLQKINGKLNSNLFQVTMFSGTKIDISINLMVIMRNQSQTFFFISGENN